MKWDCSGYRYRCLYGLLMTSSTNCNRWCGYMKGGLPERGPALPILMVISSSESGNEGSPAFSLASLDSGGRAKAIWGSAPTPCGWEKNDKTRKGQESKLKSLLQVILYFTGPPVTFKFRSTLTAADQSRPALEERADGRARHSDEWVYANSHLSTWL